MSAPLRLVAEQESRGERDWFEVIEDNRRWLARYGWAKPARDQIHRELDGNTDRLRALVAEQAQHIAELRAQLPRRPITQSSAPVRHLFAVDGGEK